MDVDWVRACCLSFPHATEQITWGSDLTFRVAGKIFAVTVLEPAPVWLSFKCSPENFAELTEQPGIIPAPYLARAQWVALENRDALTGQELSNLLRQAYELVLTKVPKRIREALKEPARKRKSAKHRSRKRSRQSAKGRANGLRPAKI